MRYGASFDESSHHVGSWNDQASSGYPFEHVSKGGKSSTECIPLKGILCQWCETIVWNNHWPQLCMAVSACTLLYNKFEPTNKFQYVYMLLKNYLIYWQTVHSIYNLMIWQIKVLLVSYKVPSSVVGFETCHIYIFGLWNLNKNCNSFTRVFYCKL